MAHAENVARKLHDAYEKLAPEFGYETRKDTKKFDPESPNGKLMIRVMEQVVIPYGNKIANERVAEAKLECMWLHHPCPPQARYGDDGEMQCGNCGIDFKRTDPLIIQSYWMHRMTKPDLSFHQFFNQLKEPK